MLAAFLAALTLFVGCLAFSPALHHALHGEAGDDAANATDGHSHPLSAEGSGHVHVCAVTLFAHGVPILDPAPVVEPVASVVTTEAHPTDFVAPEPPTFRLRPVRGPPVA